MSVKLCLRLIQLSALRREYMTDKTSNHFAIEWSEDIMDWVMQAAEQDDVEPEVAVYSTLAAAVVLARSVDMGDQAVRGHFEEILTKEFPAEMMNDGRR
jgi:hypothetical protein